MHVYKVDRDIIEAGGIYAYNTCLSLIERAKGNGYDDGVSDTEKRLKNQLVDQDEVAAIGQKMEELGSLDPNAGKLYDDVAAEVQDLVREFLSKYIDTSIRLL